MPTKNQLIELCQNNLGGGFATSDIKKKYRKGVLDIYLGMVFNDLLVQVFNNDPDPNKANLDSYVKQYTVSNLDVDYDLTYNKYFIEFPTVSTKLLQIPNDQALRDIYAKATSLTRCLKRKQGANNIYSQLEVSSYLSAIRYEVIGDKIYFTGSVVGLSSFHLHIVVPWSEYDGDELIPFPLQSEQSIFDAVIKRLKEFPPEDKIIDANVTKA